MDERLPNGQFALNRIVSPEFAEKIANGTKMAMANLSPGVKVEMYRKSSAALTGIPRLPFTDEWRQHLSEAHKGQVAWNKGMGEYNPYPDEFNEELKEEIRERDGRICQRCSLSEAENIRLYRHKLSVHHKDHNKQNNKWDNLISLCAVCHGRVETNRGYWQEYFTELIAKIYARKGGDEKCLWR